MPKAKLNEDRKEQEQIVENLIRAAQADVSGLTIIIQGDAVKFGVTGNSAPQLLIQALDIVKNDIQKSIIQYELEQESKELEGEDMQELEQS